MISNFSPGMHLACLFAEWLRESGRTFDELLRRNVLPLMVWKPMLLLLQTTT